MDADYPLDTWKALAKFPDSDKFVYVGRRELGIRPHHFVGRIHE